MIVKNHKYTKLIKARKTYNVINAQKYQMIKYMQYIRPKIKTYTRFLNKNTKIQKLYGFVRHMKKNVVDTLYKLTEGWKLQIQTMLRGI